MRPFWFTLLLVCALPATMHAQTTDRYGEPVATPDYPKISHAQAEKHIGQYRTVHGTVHSIALRRDHAYLNFGKDWKTDFTIYIPKETFKRLGPYAIRRYKGEEITIRGYVHDYYGPRITLIEPDKLEFADAETH